MAGTRVSNQTLETSRTPYLKDVVDCSATIQDPKDFSSLASGVECEREVEEMVKAQLGHFWNVGSW